MHSLLSALRRAPRTLMFWLIVAVFAVGLLRSFYPAGGFDEVRTGEVPLEVAGSDDGIWVLNHTSRSVSLIDTSTTEEVFETEVGDTVAPALTANDDGAWVILDGGVTIGRVDPDEQAVADRVDLTGVFSGEGIAQDLAAGDGFVWVTDAAGQEMVRIDTASGEVGEPIDVGQPVVQPQVVGDSLWVYETDGITEYDADTGEERNKIDTSEHRVEHFFATEDAVFILADVDNFEHTGLVIQLNPRDGSEDGQSRIQDSRPTRITVADDQIFVSGTAGFLTELEPSRAADASGEGGNRMRIVGMEQVTVSTKDLRGLTVQDGVVWVADGTNGVVHQPVDGIEGESPTETTVP